ncbi:hypothetical protein [Spiroplasma endosymbiont of Villa modesta]|uniref:hypothetical protein n=1 Tax=Spiroplasma endosymbiont of Villa modesta TaxID=3066293 RepID=UPI00313AE344
MKINKNNTTIWYVDNINGVRQPVTYHEEVWECINLNETENKQINSINNNKTKINKKTKCCTIS